MHPFTSILVRSCVLGHARWAASPFRSEHWRGDANHPVPRAQNLAQTNMAWETWKSCLEHVSNRFNDRQSGLERSTLTHTQRLEASSHKSAKCSSIPATSATAWLTFGWSWEGPLPDCLFTGYPLPRLPHWVHPSTWPHQKPKEMSSVEPHSTISLSLP